MIQQRISRYLVCSVFAAMLMCNVQPAIAQNPDYDLWLDAIYKNPEYAVDKPLIEALKNSGMPARQIIDSLSIKHRQASTVQDGSRGNSLTSTSRGSLQCDNNDIGVEAGNFGTWSGEVGLRSNASCGFQPWTPVTLPYLLQMRIMGPGLPTDICGDVPGHLLPPVSPAGGMYSILLGNNHDGGQTERLVNQFVVQPSDTNFVYHFATVLQEPGHLPSEQPYFEFVMFDAAGDTIPCSYQKYVAAPGLPGFYQSLQSNSQCTFYASDNSDVYYRPWTSVGVNLSPYVGQTVTMQCTNADCSLCGHFGYTYLDFSCMGLAGVTELCQGVDSALISVQLDTGYTVIWSNGDTSLSSWVDPQVEDSFFVYVSPPSGCGYYGLYILKYDTLEAGFADSVLCNQVYFSDTTLNTFSSAATLQWNFGDGNSSTIADPYHVYSSQGTYAITLVASTQNCIDTATLTVNVGPLPQVSVTDDTICPGVPTSFPAIISSTGGSIKWSPSSGLSNTIVAVPTVTTSTNTHYTVVYTDTMGCKVSDDAWIRMFIPILPTMGPTVSVCSLQCQTLSASGPFPLGSYSWFPSSTLSNANVANPVACPLNTTVYTVTTTDSNQCVVRGTQRVVVMALPNVTAGADTAVCLASSIQLAGNVTGATNMTWSPLQGLSNPVNPGPVYSPATSGPAWLTLTGFAANGCSASDSLLINVHPLPVVTAAGGTRICNGSSTPLSVTGATTYAWSPVQGLNNPFSSTPVAAPSASMLYTVAGTDVFGCTDQDTVMVDVSEMPQAHFGTVTDFTCEGASIRFVDSSLYAGAWNWEFNNGAISYTGSAPPPIQVPYQSTLTLLLTVYNTPCSTQVADTIHVPSLDEHVVLEPVNVFTPNGDQLNDCFAVRVEGDMKDFYAACLQLTIYDRWGKKVFESLEQGSCWDGYLPGGGKAADGTYYYIATLGNEKVKGCLSLMGNP